MSSIWDYCVIDTATAALIQSLENCSDINTRLVSSDQDAPSSSGALSSKTGFSDRNTVSIIGAATDESGIDGLQASLVSSELSCRSFMTELDSLLHTLGEVAALHDDVTGRTNSLMFNCENLLEQQHSLQATVDVLKMTLAPFNDVEGVAGLLGIPFDARGLPTKANEKSAQRSEIKAITDSFNIDPRAPEFKDVLIRLSTALKSLKGVNFLDSARYHRWLVQLQCRAASLVARSMRELLEGAANSCTVPPVKRGMGTSRGDGSSAFDRNKGQQGGTETPLESNPIYAKFRGLGFRMRELTSLLKIATPGDELSPIGNTSGGSRMVGNGMYQSSTPSPGDSFLKSEQDVMYEIKQNYITLRTKLLLPYVLESCTTTHSNPTQNPVSGVVSGSTLGGQINSSPLCPTIRQAYSTLFRVAQMEVQLFDSLFRAPDDDNEVNLSQSSSSSSNNTKSSNIQSSVEVVSIIEGICNATGDYLRPLIIHENNVDELCRVINTLSEDIKAQVDSLFPSSSVSSLPYSSAKSYQKKIENNENSKNLLKSLNKGLNKTISDAQERLSYCSEMTMRVEVQFFEPLPSQLSYPSIIEIHEKKKKERELTKIKKSKNGETEGLPDDLVDDVTKKDNDDYSRHEEIDDISATWYPPLLHTLSLLSKLYGCLEIKTFEHFASQLIFFCLTTIKKGSDKIKINGGRAANGGEINGDLFLIRHLLILREQLIPFNIKLQKKNLNLDFQPSKKALNYFVMKNMKNIINFNRNNNNIDNNGNNNNNSNDNNNNSDDGSTFSSNVGRNSNSYFYNNSFFLLAREGLPAIVENEIFIKKDLDLDLKNACQALKDSVLKNIFGGMDSFLTKITAFIGDFSVDSTPGNGSGSVMKSGTGTAYASAASKTGLIPLPLLPLEARESLKKLDFMKIERVREMLVNVQENVLLTAPDFMNSMKLYVENSIARSIILRPLLQEINSVQRKMECVISSCFDPGSSSRDLEQQLLTIINTVTTELS